MKLRKWSTWSLVPVLALSAGLAGCGGDSGSSDTAQTGASLAPAASEPPTEISILGQQLATEAIPPDNVIIKEIEKRTNTKLNINWVPNNNFSDKSKVILASGDMPDLMMISTISDPQFITMAKQGAFWDIEPFIKDYKNLSGIDPQIWADTRTAGKLFGVPRLRPMDGNLYMPLVRKDWLDKLGLKVPETMDDMYKVAKAFTENDPDGNGVKDTWGISGYVAEDSMFSLMWVDEAFTGVPGNYVLKDGAIRHKVFEKGIRDSLLWLNKAYTEKLLSQDFAILKSSQSRDEMLAGKAGIQGQYLNAQWLLTEQIRKKTPDAEMFPLSYMLTPEGKKYAPKTSGAFGMFVIPKKVPEAKVKKLLALLDFGISQEGSDLANHGLQGIHYNVVDGLKVATDQAKADMVGTNLNVIFGAYDKYLRAYHPNIPKEMYERNKKVIDERAAISVGDPSVGLESATYLKVGKDMEKKIQDMKIKVILGRESIESWDKYLDELKKNAEFMKIEEELTAALKEKSGK